MTDFRARFRIGQLVQHKLFDYRGVIVGIDPDFQGSEDWFEMMIFSDPPRDKPWYHVLVDEAIHDTYVSEDNLNPDLSGRPITHPKLKKYFKTFKQGLYQLK